MARPEFPIGVVLPASCISRIREDQRHYDEDPGGYERQEREREERRREEERQLQEDYQRQQELEVNLESLTKE